MSWLHDRIIENSRTHPNALMIDETDKSVAGQKYAQALCKVAQIIHDCIGKGGNIRAIGVLSNHRAETYLAVLAAFYAGVKFVPLNAKFPLSRLRKIRDLAGLSMIFCDVETASLADEMGLPAYSLTNIAAGDCPGGCQETLEEYSKNINSADIAYQMFTSGTTGEPKGVPITYSNMESYVQGIAAAIEFPDNARFSQLFDLSFDLAIHDIFVSLSHCGCIVPPSQIDLLMPANYIQNKLLDVWFSVPLYAQIAAKGYRAQKHTHKLRLALFCGEPLPGEYVRQFQVYLADNTQIFNLYGPTEATIAFTSCRLHAGRLKTAIAPIGAAFGENRVAILACEQVLACDADIVEGELLLGGPQVFDGYQPEVGKSVFVEHHGVRYYRSGDLVRYDGDTLHHLGRLDDQVKIRGYRVELGDVEEAFRKTFGVDMVAAFPYESGDTRRLGLAYVNTSEVEQLQRMAEQVPDYMIPEALLHLDSMPLNNNNKIDRKSLKTMLEKC